MDTQENAANIGPPDNVDGKLSGAMEHCVSYMLETMCIKDRVRMSECSKQFKQLAEKAPTTFAKVRKVPTHNEETRFAVKVKTGKTVERYTLPFDVFVRMMKIQNSTILDFSSLSIDKPSLLTSVEEMERAELRDIKIEDLSLHLDEDNKEAAVKLLELTRPADLLCLHLDGKLTQDIFDRVIKTEHWKKCTAVDLNADQITFEYDEILKNFNKFKLNVTQISADDCLKLIKSFRSQQRPRLSEFYIQTSAQEVDRAIVAELRCSMTNGVLMQTLSLEYTADLVLQLMIHKHGVKGVICKRGEERTDFGKTYAASWDDRPSSPAFYMLPLFNPLGRDKSVTDYFPYIVANFSQFY